MADIPESTKLLPCPFCGGEAEVIRKHCRVVVLCPSAGPVCLALQSESFGNDDAIAAWNTRAAPPAMDREAVAKAIGDADAAFGYSCNLTRLVDGVATYTLTMAGYEPADFDSIDDAHIVIAERRNAARADAILSTLSADAIRQGEGKYLVWSNEHRAWWGPDERGYTRIIERAGRYDRDKAFSISSKRGGGWQREENPDEIAIPEADAIAQYVGPRLATPASHASDGGKA